MLSDNGKYSFQEFTSDIRSVIQSLLEVQRLLSQSELSEKSNFNELVNDSIGSLLELYDVCLSKVEEVNAGLD